MSVSKSEYMLKYQKAKVKLLEYDVPIENYPKFPLNYRELAFPTILILSEFADAVIEDDSKRIGAIKDYLQLCSEYYDAAMKSREQIYHDLDFLLVGATAYFFQDSFGSAMVLLAEIHCQMLLNDVRGVLANIFELVFYGRKKIELDDPVLISFEKYIQTGEMDEVNICAYTKAKNAYRNCNEIEAFYSDIVYAVIKIALKNSARQLLPIYSGVEGNRWTDYFKQSTSIKMIWPAQRLIGEKGILRGKNGIVQLPTGVGKTKSIELIIRSMFLAERGNIALIVAPLRALCNEITYDMRKAFPKNTGINQFSDLLELDFESFFEEAQGNTIIVCTPEKLQYILHHRYDLLYKIDLLIFDEGHLFDDMNRGAMFELLIESIKESITPNQQMVLLSAVLPNADDILTWVSGQDGVLAYDKRIKSTPKVIGFSSKKEEVHYYSSSFDVEEFFIPHAIKRKELLRKSNRGKKKYFPESTSHDIALYFANQLCKNGGVAIYVAQRRSIPTILKRALELQGKGCSLSALSTVSDVAELQKLHTLIQRYYGKDYIYVQAALKGILPHYSSLPNGLRMAVEYAFRKGLIKAVICTSTLAQGVNIPIKYLIMTSLRSAQNVISARNLQNLMGRTARSGVFTEGSIIISDPKLYDERGGGRGYYNWQNAINMFQPQSVEACGSAILSLAKPLVVDYETAVDGDEVIKFICRNISDNWGEMMKKSLFDELEKVNKKTSLNMQTISQRVDEYKNILGIIENEICHVIAQSNEGSMPVKEKIHQAAMHIYDKSLAKVLANDGEKALLMQLFTALAERLSTLQIDIPKIGISMVGVDLSSKIQEMIDKYRLNEEKLDENILLQIVENLFNNLYPDDQVTIELCEAWINGASYDEMASVCDMKIIDVEKKCGQTISYHLSFLIGNIIDYLSDDSVNLSSLTILQKKIKYGVNSITAISICEQIVNDRLVANILVAVLKNNIISSDKIIMAIKNKHRDVLATVEMLPTLFYERLENI